MKIFVLGSIAFDQFYGYDRSFLTGIRPEALDTLSVAFQVKSCIKAPGGGGANIASALGLLGQPSLLYSTVGTDGGDLLKALQARGVDTRYVREVTDKLTASCAIGTDTEEHQITFWYAGADDDMAWQSPKERNDEIDYAIVGPIHPHIAIKALEWADAADIPVIFDPGQHILQYSVQQLWEALNHSTGLIVNEYEWNIIQQKLQVNPQQLIQETIFEAEFSKEMTYLVVTRGEEGFSLDEPGRTAKYPACAVQKPINPTGAGDAFRAGLLTGLARGWSLDVSCKLGAAIGSFVVEQQGAILETLDMTELKRRYKEAYGEELPTL